MKTRIFHTKFWEDNYIMSLNREEKLMFCYLLTNEKVGLTGIYELSDKYLCFMFDLSLEELTQIKNKFITDKKFYFWNGWVVIINALKYNNYASNTKLKKAYDNEYNLIPTQLKTIIQDQKYTSIDTSIIVVSHRNDTLKKSKIINNKIKNNKIINIYTKISDLKEKELQEIATKYQVPLSFVLSKLDDLENWIEEKPTRSKGRNLKRTLMNWVKRDSISIKSKMIDPQRRNVDATDL